MLQAIYARIKMLIVLGLFALPIISIIQASRLEQYIMPGIEHWTPEHPAQNVAGPGFDSSTFSPEVREAIEAIRTERLRRVAAESHPTLN